MNDESENLGQLILKHNINDAMNKTLDRVFINYDNILSGWKYLVNRDGEDGPIGEVSVGRICNWGGHYIAIIHDDVPEEDREEYAKFIAEAPEKIKSLEKRIEELKN